MPLIGGSCYIATFKGFQQGQLVENILRWDSEQDTSRVDSYFVAAHLDTLWRENIVPLLSTNYYYTGVSVWGSYTAGTADIEGYLLPGDLAGDALPVFMAAGIRKNVFAIGQEGVQAGSVKGGSLRLAGIPESVQSNGVPSDAGWVSDLNAALALFKTITGLLGQLEDLHMTIARLGSGGLSVAPLALAIVSTIAFQRFTTQNTRKR